MPRTGGAKAGQAMIETVVAVLVITFVFLALFRLSHMLTGKILLEHAAMRVARARLVGLNDFMCLKAARVSVIPVAGERLWPENGERFDWAMENARAKIYMETGNGAIARGVLEYEGWNRLRVEAGRGGESRVYLENEWFDLRGKASLEHNHDFYMDDEGR